MPRPRNKERWDSDLYSIGFVFNRGGIAYINISEQVVKSLRMKYISKNKRACLDILNQEVFRFLNPQELEVKYEQLTTFKLWDRYCQAKFPTTSKANRKKLTSVFSLYLTKDILLTNIEEIRSNILTNIYERKPALSISTINKTLKIFKQIFDFGKEEEYLKRNPINGSIIPKVGDIEVKTFKPGEINSIIQSLYGNHLELAYLVEFLYITGMRINEALQIYWKDIDKDKIIIHGKGRENRQFPIKLFPELIVLIENLNKIKTTEKLFTWKTYARLEHILRETTQTLKIYEPRKSFHSIRKTRLNDLLEDQRFDINILSEILGHSPAVMEKYYRSNKQAKRITEIVEERTVRYKSAISPLKEDKKEENIE